jgi:hypothetical protein
MTPTLLISNTHFDSSHTYRRANHRHFTNPLQVTSLPATAAVNYWFDSALSWVIPNHTQSKNPAHATSAACANASALPTVQAQADVTAQKSGCLDFLLPSQLLPNGARTARP